MPISIPALLSYLIFVGSTRAQITAASCTNQTYNWTFNSLQQSPCLVTAYLAATCNNGSFNVPTLQSGYSYNGPSGIDDGDLCKCNTVLYNLISACDACQGEPWINYTVWTSNCTTKETPGIFPNHVPAGTRVPHWAYIDTSIGNGWNASEAHLDGDSPEVTGTASIVPTSTTQASQSVTASASSSSSSALHHSSNTSAIAGGIVGGVVGAALISGIVLWIVLRLRRARSVPSAYMDFQSGEKEQPPPHLLVKGTPKLYDPSDPTTYPSEDYLPGGNQQLGSTSHTQPSGDAYSGLPEI